MSSVRTSTKAPDRPLGEGDDAALVAGVAVDPGDGLGAGEGEPVKSGEASALDDAPAVGEEDSAAGGPDEVELPPGEGLTGAGLVGVEVQARQAQTVMTTAT